jgi:hypothetical protein
MKNHKNNNKFNNNKFNNNNGLLSNIKKLRFIDLSYDQLVNEFEKIRDDDKFMAMIYFINEYSKKDPLTTDIIKFFSYIYSIKNIFGRKNLEMNFRKYMPFNNICWNKIYNNNTDNHCNAIKIFHDFGFSIDTTNNQGEDAIVSLCATFNSKNSNAYSNVNNRIALFNALMTPTKTRIRSILNEIMAKSVSNNVEYIKKIRWCLLIDPYTTIEQMIYIFFALSNNNNKNNIYDELVNYFTKSISGINNIKKRKTLDNNIRHHLSTKSKYDIYIEQHNDKFMSETEIKDMLFDILVVKGYDNYKLFCKNKFKDNEHIKIQKIQKNINNYNNLYKLINNVNINTNTNNITSTYNNNNDNTNINGISVTEHDMDNIHAKINEICKFNQIVSELENKLDILENETHYCEEDYSKIYEELEIEKGKESDLIFSLEQYIFNIMKRKYNVDYIDSIIPLHYNSIKKLQKKKNLLQFNEKLNELLNEHIINELIFCEKSKQNINNNFENNVLEHLNELDNLKINSYLLMCFLISKNFFQQHEINIIVNNITNLCDGSISDINIIHSCLKFVPYIKKYFLDIFLKIAKYIKSESNVQKKFKMMDILESTFNIQLALDIDFEKLEQHIIELVDIKKNNDSVKNINYSSLLSQYNTNDPEPKISHNITPKNSITTTKNSITTNKNSITTTNNSITPKNSITVTNNTKVHLQKSTNKSNKLTNTKLCKFIGMGEKCKYGKKCKFSHRIN